MSNESSLKQKTIKSIFWSIGDQIANQGIQFILQIILARLLLPEHFGIIGMILVFILISNIIIDSGFTQALVREQEVNQADYSTVFYFNLLVAFILYGALFSIAPLISTFYHEPQLVPILRVLSLSLIINSLSIIQRTQLIKNIDFKTQTKINFISGMLSGVLAIVLALLGFGVWSLVVKTISLQLFQLILLWILNDWKPSFIFKFDSFKRMFGFGSKLMTARLISIIYSNIFFIVIGKLFSVTQLGYYTNAVKITETASLSITSALQKVTFPVFSSIQDDKERLKNGFKKIIKMSAFINFPIMMGLAAIADPLVHLLFGENWVPMIIYFQLLCLAGMLYPLHDINLNILKVKGKSNLYLLLNIIQKIILTLLIIGAVWFGLGVIGLIGVIVLQSYIEFFINSYFAGREISYPTTKQIKDLVLIYIITIIMGVIVYLSGMFLPENNIIKLSLQIIVGSVVYIGMSKLTKVKELNEVWNLMTPIVKKLLIKKNERVLNNKV